MLSLPEELLDAVVSELAFISPHISLLPSCWIPEHLRFPCPSPALASLSLVNKDLRRICLPYLFAHVRIKRFSQATEFNRFWSPDSPLLKFTKVLSVQDFRGPRKFLSKRRPQPPPETKTLCDLLPRFEHLSSLNLVRFGLKLDYEMLREVVDDIPSISTVVVGPCGHISTPPSPKFIFTSVVDSVFHRQISQVDHRKGPNMCHLTILPHAMTEELLSLELKNLHELVIHLSPLHIVSVSWITRFASAHPQLKRLSFTGEMTAQYFHALIPASYIDPSLRNFISQLCRNPSSIIPWLDIHHIGLVRMDADSESGWQWKVTELAIFIQSSLLDILGIISDTLPDLEHLSIDLRHNSDEEEEMYLAAAYARFRRITVMDFVQSKKLVPNLGTAMDGITHIPALGLDMISYLTPMLTFITYVYVRHTMNTSKQCFKCYILGYLKQIRYESEV